MVRIEYVCLNCGHRLKAYKKKTNSPRQCPKCWSYDLMDLETYERCKKAVKEAQEDALFPGLAGIMAIIGELGVRFKPLSTLNLLRFIEEDLRGDNHAQKNERR